MSDLAALFAAAPVARLGTGKPVFHCGDRVRDVIFVQSGAVALRRVLSEGATLTLQIAEGGALLAEASLFAERYHCDAVVRTDAELRRIRKGAFLAALAGHPDTLMALFAASATEVRAQRARVEILRMKRLSDRLDAWLALQGPPGPGGWAEVADAIGVTPAALYRERAKRRRMGGTPK
ncbi:Crp/Fnr family transcriptional regulator [Maribius pontilimi]|uniref:Crp/Fnr family transcriptional regulator n=1 Tax=Palleronia pontilimi TaxID=1964209 RepID=A0A934MDM7_9RHOB|nr:Crp/Fnr family transcriptional regulator [Palleronia pontilimi]MBJ3762541.1 Crp/Fnr family transcriptional regulator [Palleronia pontilimi]